MTSFSRMPPKYSCTICGRVFRRKKQHFNHVMRNKCNRVSYSASESATGTNGQEIEIEAEYIGREYNFNPIPTGNRHYRTGIPLPRISRWNRAAI